MSSAQTKLVGVFIAAFAFLLTLLPSLSYADWYWTPSPVTVGSGQHPQVATDANGISTAIWVSTNSPSSIQGSRFVNDAWVTPVTISTTGNASNPQLVISGNGIVTAVWQQQSDDDSVIYASRFNGNWSTPTAISLTTGNAVHPHVTVDANGIVTAVWQQLSGNQSVIYVSRFNGSGWTSPTTISAANSFSQTPQVHALSNGEVLAVWQNFPAGLGGNTDSLIQGSRWNGSSWTAPVSISASGHHAQTPHLAPNGNGAQTVWQQDDGNLGWVIASALFSSSVWNTPVMLTPTGEFARHPVIRSDATGKVWAVWERNEGLYWSVRGATFANGSWSSPTLLESSAQDQLDPTLGIDNLGTAIAVWQRDDGTYDRIRSLRSGASGWTGALDLSTANQNAQAPQIALDSFGIATVVWQTFNGSNWIIQSRRGYESLVALTVSKTGSGSITGGAINCGNTCQANLNRGSTIQLTATPLGRNAFTGWGGDCSGNGVCDLTMNTAKTASAAFTALPNPILTVTSQPGGSVKSNPNGIDCGSTCQSAFPWDSSVTLTATATSGYRFDGWTSACAGTLTCTLTMDGDKTTNAQFSVIPVYYSLSVTRSGEGSISSTPSGISCPTLNCSANFLKGTEVTLSPTPASGYYFDHWAGACSGSATCKVSMTQAQSVGAVFTLAPVNQKLLTVTVNGKGTITSIPSGINCGATCSYPFDQGKLVDLIATPDKGQTFMGWSGACQGKTSCSVTLSEAQTVSAKFVNTYLLILPAIQLLLE